MPEAAQEHRDHEVPVRVDRPVPVAPERDVEVVPEPARQRDVPARPELAEALREVRRVEVDAEVVAQHPGHPDGDVGVAREVAVDLEGVEHHADRDADGRERLGRVEHAVDVERQRVGDDDLLEVPDEDLAEPQQEPAPEERVVPAELREEQAGPDDGPGHELGEERDVGREPEQVPLDLDAPTVQVDRVAQRLERVERDPDREDDRQERRVLREPEKARRPVDAVEEEVEVLEDRQQPQVGHHADRQPRLLPPRVVRVDDPHADDVVDERRERDEPEEAPVPPPVEQVARREAHDEPDLPPGREVGDEEGREEDQEREAVKEHEPSAAGPGRAPRPPGPARRR